VVNSRKYYPSTQWASAPTGKGLNFQRAQSLWELLTRPDEDIDIATINSIFFDELRGHPARAADGDTYGYESMSMQEALTEAANLRGSTSTMREYLAEREYHSVYPPG
jgi:hypothetical protein